MESSSSVSLGCAPLQDAFWGAKQQSACARALVKVCSCLLCSCLYFQASPLKTVLDALHILIHCRAGVGVLTNPDLLLQDLVYMVMELMENDLMRANADEQLRVSKEAGISRDLGWYGR